MNKYDPSQCFNSREMLLTQIYIGRLTELPTLVNVYILLVHLRFPQELKNQDILLLDW